MPEQSPVLAAAAEYKAALMRKEAAAVNRLVAAYKRSLDRIERSVEALVAAIGDDRPTRGQLLRMKRYRELTEQVLDELRGLQALTRHEMDQAARIGIQAGGVDAAKLMSVSITGGAGLAGQFNRLPVAAIEQILGFLDPDGPLYARLQLLAPVTTEYVADAIAEGASLGHNPRRIAASVRRAFGRGLTDSLRFTRTVQLWSYREASRATYLANSNVVQMWQWSSALDSRTCSACIAMHGSTHPLSEPLRGHYNCRCSPVPVVVGFDPSIKQNGEEWFLSQDEGTQRAILGPGRFDAWKAGKFEFRSVAGEHEDTVYGRMIVERPLKELTRQ